MGSAAVLTLRELQDTELELTALKAALSVAQVCLCLRWNVMRCADMMWCGLCITQSTQVTLESTRDRLRTAHHKLHAQRSQIAQVLPSLTPPFAYACGRF